MSKLHHQCPALVPTPEEALRFFTGKGCAVETKQLWFSVALVYHFTISLLRKGNRGHSSSEAFHRHMVKLSLPYLAWWLFTWRKAFFQQEQGAHTCLWQAQNSQRRKPCAGRWPGTEMVQVSLPTWYFQTNSACSSQDKCVLHQKEVCANLIKSLNLSHILTYEGIFSHHFPQWNCKWLVTRILAITNNYIMNHHLPLCLHSFFMARTISSQSNPHPKRFKTFLLSSSQGLGKQVINLSVTSKVYTQILPLKICC